MDPYIKLIETGAYDGGTAQDIAAWRNNTYGTFRAASWSDRSRHLVRQVLSLSMLYLIYDERPGFLINEYAKFLKRLCLEFKDTVGSGDLSPTEEVICQKAIRIIEAFEARGPGAIFGVFSPAEVLYYFVNDGAYVPNVGPVATYEAFLDFRHQVVCIHTDRPVEPTTISEVALLVPRLATERVHLQPRAFYKYQFDLTDMRKPTYNFFHFFACFDISETAFLPLLGILAAHAHELDYNNIQGTNSSIFYNLFRVTFSWTDPFDKGPKTVPNHSIVPFVDLLVSFRKKHNMVFDRQLLAQIFQGTDLEALRYIEQSDPFAITTETHNIFINSVFGEFAELNINASTEAEDPDEDPAAGDPNEDDPDDPDGAEGGADDPEDSADDAEPVETAEEVKVHTNDNVGIEITPAETEVSIDGVVFRKEVRGLINDYLIKPPPKMSMQNLQILKILKVYWLNLLSIPTILAIMKVANSPVKITFNK